jgi:hypothetical protein
MSHEMSHESSPSLLAYSHSKESRPPVAVRLFCDKAAGASRDISLLFRTRQQHYFGSAAKFANCPRVGRKTAWLTGKRAYHFNAISDASCPNQSRQIAAGTIGAGFFRYNPSPGEHRVGHHPLTITLFDADGNNIATQSIDWKKEAEAEARIKALAPPRR